MLLNMNGCTKRRIYQMECDLLLKTYWTMHILFPKINVRVYF